MVKATNALMIDVDHNELHRPTYDDDAPISATSSQSRISNAESTQIVRPKQSRWRKMADIVAPQLPKSQPTKKDSRSGGPRRLTNTDSLILLFQARKRRIDELEYNSGNCSDAREPISSIDRSYVESPNSDCDDKLPVITASTPPDLAALTKDGQQNDSDDPCEKLTVTPDGVTVCDTSVQTMPHIATPFGYLFNGDVPTKGRNRTDSLNIEHAILKRGFNCHDLILRNAGHTPRVDNIGVVTWVNEKTPTVPKIKLGGARGSSGECKKGEDNKHHSVHTRSSYETLLRYLTIVRDYPEEFEKLRHLSVNESTRPTSVRRLVNVGSAFSRIQRAIGKRETPVQLAAYELGCRQRLRPSATASSLSPWEDRPSTQLKHRAMSRQNSTLFRIHSSIVENDHNESVCLLNSKHLAQHGVVVSELWRAREDAEKAMASLSTYRSQIETEMALESLEEEKGSIQQWWVAQKDCRYLRSRGSAECLVSKKR